MMSRLLELARILRSVFVAEKKASLTMEAACSRMAASYSSALTAGGLFCQNQAALWVLRVRTNYILFPNRRDGETRPPAGRARSWLANPSSNQEGRVLEAGPEGGAVCGSGQAGPPPQGGGAEVMEAPAVVAAELFSSCFLIFPERVKTNRAGLMRTRSASSGAKKGTLENRTPTV